MSIHTRTISVDGKQCDVTLTHGHTAWEAQGAFGDYGIRVPGLQTEELAMEAWTRAAGRIAEQLQLVS
jgi:hypothetical protein